MSSDNERAAITLGGYESGRGQGTIGLSLNESVEDHLNRAGYFILNFTSAPDEKVANWCLMAAVNSAVASFEIARTYYEEILHKEPTALILEAEIKIRHFKILEIIRIHDFHRRAVGLSNNTEFVSGPIHSKGNSKPGSIADIRVSSESGRIIGGEGKNSSINLNRMLHAKDFTVLDTAIDEFVRIDFAILEYITDLLVFLNTHFLLELKFPTYHTP